MDFGVTPEDLVAAGATAERAREIMDAVRMVPGFTTEGQAWSQLSRETLTPADPFSVHRYLYQTIYENWPDEKGPAPAWRPAESDVRATNLNRTLLDRGFTDFDELHAWSVGQAAEFWHYMADRLGVVFHNKPTESANLNNLEQPVWFPDATLNIAESCFCAEPDDVAIVFQREGFEIESITYVDLRHMANQVANSLSGVGVGPGDAVAIAMPMTLEAVAAYLGIVMAGAVVVSIADSFAPEEIAIRLRTADAKVVITQDVIVRAGKVLPLYQKVVDAGATTIVVIPAGEIMSLPLRDEDIAWLNFLSDDTEFDAIPCVPEATTNILFSSGTTGAPKAIPWSHTTPMKCAVDGHFHHDVQARDVVAWPTNLGWMMGPWLIYATLMNQATIALYYGAPNTTEFCEFVEDTKVNMLGVVPSLVKVWRANNMTDGIDWKTVRLFSSTGEASNADDYLWLMSRAGYKPVIEYCGGTEIGGGYLTGTLMHPSAPATFSCKCIGLDFIILSEAGEAANSGELFILPPSVGLSLTLLNRDHHEVYYADTPPADRLLRRHGDQIESLPGGFYRAQGRADDTMNLGGIKISSAEIERAVNDVAGVNETAAIAVAPPDGGPGLLIIFVVPEIGAPLEGKSLKGIMQRAISSELNPLFRVHEVVLIEALPRTASNKVMRRVLRDQYRQERQDERSS